MRLDDLGTCVQSAGLGVLGTDLFVGTMPLETPGDMTPDVITALVEIAGFPVVQLVVRGAPSDSTGARNQAQAIGLALDRMRHPRLDGTTERWSARPESVWKWRYDDVARPLMTAHVRCEQRA